MLLKVGELAKRTGVTVRALHHYDSIGLLRPSGRSEGGYRLYDEHDVARLHGIQALRRMGVPLAEVAQLLDGGSGSLEALLAQQVRGLEQEIARAQALRERLGVMQLVLASGRQPATDDWLASLSMMSTLEQYFSVAELKRAFERWKRCAAEWPPVVRAIRAAMARGVPTDAVELQPLLHRWLDVATRWMDGDLHFLDRWARMLREQPGLLLPAGMDLALLAYVEAAIGRRVAVLERLAGPEVRARLAETRAAWLALVERGRRLMDDGVPPDADAARALAGQWQALLARTFGADTATRDRVLEAYETDPLLQAGLPFSPALRRYVESASGA